MGRYCESRCCSIGLPNSSVQAGMGRQNKARKEHRSKRSLPRRLCAQKANGQRAAHHEIKSGANIHFFKCHNPPEANQEFTLLEDGTVQNAGTELCVAIGGTATIIAQTCNKDNINQQWKWTAAEVEVAE